MRAVPAVLTLALLGGCSLAPTQVRPDLPTAPIYTPSDEPSGEQRATEIGWRDFFHDPALRTMIAAALDNNRDLRVATAQIAEARAQYRIQRSDRLPQLDAQGGATRSRTPIGSTGAVAGGTGAITQDRYQIGVAATSFELDFWGRVANLSEAARAEYLATVAAQRAFRLSLIADVASAYYTLLGANEQIELARATLASREQGLRIAGKRLQAGITSALDYRQAEALLTQAQSEFANQELERARARNLLSVLLGGPLPPQPDEYSTLEQQSLARNLEAGLPSELLLNRPDIIAAEERLRAARANIGAARAAFFPSISLTGSAGFASTSLGDLVGSDGLSWSFGPSISLPIFDWGRREAQLDVAQARERIEVAQYERTVQVAFQEVSDALAGRRYLADEVAAQERAVKAQAGIAHLARLRYREGVAEYLEVLDAERSLFSAQQALILLRRQQLDNLVRLYIALGGGLR